MVPFATLGPLKAVLPLRRGETRIPADPDSKGGIRLAALDRRMRERWRTVSSLWEENKAAANNLDLDWAVGLLWQALDPIGMAAEPRR